MTSRFFLCVSVWKFLTTNKILLWKHDRPLPQVLRRLDEIQMNELPVATFHMSPPTVLKKKHFDGTMINSCNGNKQFKMLLFRSWTICTNNNSDCFVKMSDKVIVKVLNLTETKDGIFLIGQHFMRKRDSFSFPLESSRLGIYCAEGISPIQRWPITKFKCKAIFLPKSVNNKREFHFYLLLMLRN
jgi:hypothetical protein